LFEKKIGGSEFEIKEANSDFDQNDERESFLSPLSLIPRY
jgi:hypothetical protein